MTKSALSRGLLVATGIIAVGLGTIGVFVPLLPFLLLAAACFIRSSERLYDWLIHHRWFGGYIPVRTVPAAQSRFGYRIGAPLIYACHSIGVISGVLHRS